MTIVNSVWTSDAISSYRFSSTLAQVMTCCLTVQNHYLTQYWLIGEVLWHSSQHNFTVSTQATMLYNKFEFQTFKITATSPRGQWINLTVPVPRCQLFCMWCLQEHKNIWLWEHEYCMEYYHWYVIHYSMTVTTKFVLYWTFLLTPWNYCIQSRKTTITIIDSCRRDWFRWEMHV